MKNSKLKLNADKTEFLVVGTPGNAAEKTWGLFPDTYFESEYHISHLNAKCQSNV